MHENEAREEMCRVGKSLFERGYVHASAGNISMRLDDGFLITPTDACLGFLDPAALARLDAKGNHVSGDRPSKTIVLHQRIYAAARAFDGDTACVIHTHSHACVALSLAAADTPADGAGRELMPALTPYFVMKVGHVPVIPYRRPGAAQAADLVAAAIGAYGGRGTPIRSVMLERLGPNVWHDTPAAAMATLEELEETARLWLGCRQSPRAPEPLDEAQLSELREVFGARW
ncbi:class II aldolase/adducin family protein [Pollutimonas bauzanensis]|uniref:Ribulose-5-phosphate 4-epimerase/Fuculose-1-phosphate aldolase n=1 Tax=Pollutimonas bauzanensis TaxID=658167 RepID=A0A1M5QTK8_9BURK|nr:aldolase [Pollutimonas bauzanensis]SHH17422.1 Ribulose-5-phosphate 4-epimerase/Fuculose-1-phosphate aldolase [Pollutimonas bauzanensis]